MRERIKMSEQFTILEAHGFNWVNFGAEHDMIYSGLTAENLDPDSEDGKKLQEAGWFISDEYDQNWVKFV